ncbi:MAG TPA: serine/threonine dehydratase [Pseudonocardiaceae bacterium]|nr:serine/threonine dehydratase [Pseudonocardiaceae bacterium]
MTISLLPTESDVHAAADRIRRYVRRTPMLRADVDGRPVVFKLEHLQRTGSFKLRGALNALLVGPRPNRVITASGGNHGLAVATAAALVDLPATIYLPESAPAGKARRIEAIGARLVRFGETYAVAAAEARRAASELGARYLHAYDDAAVVGGQGTVAAEVITDAPDVTAIAVAVGGGGLAAGTVLGAAGRAVVAVEPERCCCFHAALDAGEPVDSAVDSIAASGLGASRVGDIPFALLRAAGATSVLVSDAELVAARDRLWEEFRLAVEPAAAAPFAAWLAGRVPESLTCVVLCGANTDWLPV